MISDFKKNEKVICVFLKSIIKQHVIFQKVDSLTSQREIWDSNQIFSLINFHSRKLSIIRSPFCFPPPMPLSSGDKSDRSGISGLRQGTTDIQYPKLYKHHRGEGVDWPPWTILWNRPLCFGYAINKMQFYGIGWNKTIILSCYVIEIKLFK